MSRPDDDSIEVRNRGHRRVGALPFLFALIVSSMPLSGLAAQEMTEPHGEASDLLATRLDRIVSDPALIRAHVGLAVQVAETGEVLYESEAEKRFVPASNTKIVTAAVALDALPRGFRWTTRIVADGPIRDGTLQGNLWIIGGGDPVLSRKDVAGWTSILDKAGIKRIDGDIIGDDSVFEDGQWGDGWMWDDVYGGWATGSSGLQLHPNTVRAHLIPGPVL
jgi:D-alanyl-D-alanine carboxypeptidase/D-alanyl-D-alanine-endopeptidase (penicillin-binding protein 4)